MIDVKIHAPPTTSKVINYVRTGLIKCKLVLIASTFVVFNGGKIICNFIPLGWIKRKKWLPHNSSR